MLDGRFSHVTSYADTRQATGEITGENMNEWISVTERLPEINQNILISTGRLFVGEGCYTGNGNWTQYRWSVNCMTDVTHWMPLPEAPVASNTDFNLTQPAASQVKS